jgi:hypothetical protein
MPKHKHNTKAVTKLVHKILKSSNTHKTVTTGSAVIISPGARRANKRSNHRNPRPMTNTLTKAYINTLNNPWEYDGVPLGFGTMIPTTQYTGFSRNIVPLASDGSFAIAVQSSAANSVLINVAGLTSSGSSSWNIASAVNLTGINKATITGRVVSMGLRVKVLYPSTSQPGILWYGFTTDVTSVGYVGNSPAEMQGFSTSSVQSGDTPVTVLGRPIDPDSFVFFPTVINGYGGNALPNLPTLYVTGSNFASGATFMYDIIWNFEGLPISNDNGITDPTMADSPNTLSDYFPSIETMWRVVKRGLIPSLVDNATAMLSNQPDHRMLHTMGSGAHFLRSMFSQQGKLADRLTFNSNVKPGQLTEEEKFEEVIAPQKRLK